MNIQLAHLCYNSCANLLWQTIIVFLQQSTSKKLWRIAQHPLIRQKRVLCPMANWTMQGWWTSLQKVLLIFYELFGFTEFGFNPNETVALMGAHTLGQVIIYKITSRLILTGFVPGKDSTQRPRLLVGGSRWRPLDRKGNQWPQQPVLQCNFQILS